MGDAPWNRNEGKFDTPSSSAPGRFVGTGTRRRFKPSAEALRGFGAEVVDDRPVLFVTGFSVGVPEPSPAPRHYDSRPGRRKREAKEQ